MAPTATAGESAVPDESNNSNAPTSGRETATTAVFKLAEVASRLLFLLAALLLLDPASAGQFGLLNTLIALFALFVGFERWGVLWRELAKVNEYECGAIIANTLKFFQFNYLLWAPIFIVAGRFWIQLTWPQIALGLCIAVCEQLSMGAYWLATVRGKYRWLIFITAIRNLGLLLSVASLALGFPGVVTLSILMQIWAVAGLLTLIAFMRLHRGDHSARLKFNSAQLREILVQYKQSRTHFLTGSAAFTSGQIDRIVVGMAVGLTLTGIYFKNVFLAASIYSAATIFLHNRAVPKIYRETALKRHSEVLQIARKEGLKAFATYSTVVLCLLFAAQLPQLGGLLIKSSISAQFLIGLLIAYFLRTLADYNCTILNAAGLEKLVFAIHTGSISASVLLIYFLTYFFGIAGTVSAMICGSTVLLITSEVVRFRALRSHQVRT